jgi:hypothetical protein
MPNCEPIRSPPGTSAAPRLCGCRLLWLLRAANSEDGSPGGHRRLLAQPVDSRPPLVVMLDLRSFYPYKILNLKDMRLPIA